MNWMVPFVTVTFFTLGFMYLINRLLGPVNQPVLPYLFGWLAVAIYINGLPDFPSAFFNNSQALAFHVPLILMLFLLGNLLTMFRYRLRNPMMNLLRFLIASSFIFCLCGSNEHLALLLMSMMVLTLLARLFLFYKLDGQMLLYLIVGCLGMVLLLLSPITFDKLQISESYPYNWNVVWKSGLIGFKKAAIWGFSPGLLLIVSASFLAGLKAMFPGGLGRLHPIWLLAGLGIIIWIASLPYYFGVNLKPWELENTVYFLYFIGVIITAFQTGFYFQNRVKMVGYPVWVLVFMLVMASGFLLSALQSGNLGMAYSDWLSGRAKAFSHEIQKVHLKDSTQNQVFKLYVPNSFVPSIYSTSFESRLEKDLTAFYRREITIQAIDKK